MTGTLNGLFDLTGRVTTVADGWRGVGSWIAGDEFGASLHANKSQRPPMPVVLPTFWSSGKQPPRRWWGLQRV